MTDLDEVARLGITTAHNKLAATLIEWIKFGNKELPISFLRNRQSEIKDLSEKQDTGITIDYASDSISLTGGIAPKWYCKDCFNYQCQCLPRSKFLITPKLTAEQKADARAPRSLYCKHCGKTDNLNMSDAEFSEFYEYWQDKHQDCTIEYRKRKTA